MTEAARSKSWTFFVLLNAVDVGSNLEERMFVCAFILFMLSYVGLIPRLKVLPSMYRVKILQKAAKAQHKSCIAINNNNN
jgi:hypothetical protein